MATTTRRQLLLAPLLAICVTFGALVVTADAARASVDASVLTRGGLLRERTGPSTQAEIVALLPNLSGLSIDCQVAGDYVSGAARDTSQWDRLANGRYVSHAFVATEQEIRACGTSPSPAAAPAVVPGGNGDFIAAAAGPAQQNQREYHVPASVTIAQAIIESGWGRSALAANDHNYFGIKCFSGTYGTIATGCHTYRTVECEPGCAQTTASFRVYASITDSFRDHGYFLTTNPRYAPAFTHPNDANAFLMATWKAGYATSPTYYTDVTTIMTRYNLYQYDAA